MLLNEIVICYATLFEISTKEVMGFIESFIGVVKSKYPEVEIITLEKSEDDIIFILENEIRVKFSPPETIPIVILPAGYSVKEVIYNFQLCAHLGNNRDLFTEENIALLKRVNSFKDKTSKEFKSLNNTVAYNFKIPASERLKLWRLNSEILSIINRIKEIEKQGIIVGSKVVLDGDKKDFREVYRIKPNFYLKLKGVSDPVEPQKVKVM